VRASAVLQESVPRVTEALVDGTLGLLRNFPGFASFDIRSSSRHLFLIIPVYFFADTCLGHLLSMCDGDNKKALSA
jgi:hypothetical protein